MQPKIPMEVDIMIRFLRHTISVCKQEDRYYAVGDQGQTILPGTDLKEFAIELSHMVYSFLSGLRERDSVEVIFPSSMGGCPASWLHLVVLKGERGKIDISEILRELDEEGAKIFLESFSKKFCQTVCFDSKPWAISR